MTDIEKLRAAVSRFDESLGLLVDDDPEARMNAILDAAALLTAAKSVVLAA